MSALLIFSFILFVFHIFSLRTIFKLGNREITATNSKIPEETQGELPVGGAGVPVGFLLPILIIIFLTLAELAYYFFAVYLLNDRLIIAGASVLAGFNIYSFIRFLPRIRLIVRKPLEYLKEKADPFENITNIIIAFLEILFCLYVIIKIILK